MISPKKVVVIGVGAAGITATYRLRRAGVDVVCLKVTRLLLERR